MSDLRQATTAFPSEARVWSAIGGGGSQMAMGGRVNSRWLQAPCPCRKLNPDILMVQSAQDWQGQNATDGLDGA